MGPGPGQRSGLVVVGTIGVALCCALPALAGLGVLTGIGMVWGPLAAAVVVGALGVTAARRRWGRREADGRHVGGPRAKRGRG